MNLIRLLVNWLILLTSPIWFFAMLFYKLTIGAINEEFPGVASGRKWFWE